jgi:hypothetical protein
VADRFDSAITFKIAYDFCSAVLYGAILLHPACCTMAAGFDGLGVHIREDRPQNQKQQEFFHTANLYYFINPPY